MPPPRLLFLSPGIPHPSVGANVVAQYQYLTGFRDAGYHILQVMLLKERNVDPGELARHRAVFGSGTFRILAATMPGLFVQGRRFFHPFTSAHLPQNIADAIRDFAPDFCFCMDIAAAGVRSTLGVPAPTLVWLGDLNFNVVWYRAWYAARERWTAVFSLPRAWAEAQAWRAFYRSVLRKMNRVVVSAQSSEAVLGRLGVRSTFLPYPWPDCPYPHHAKRLSEQPTFVFFGHLDGLGSRSALHFLLEKLHLRLVAVWGRGGFSIIICGIHALPAWTRDAMAHAPEMRCIGFVDDLAAVLLSSHGVIVPIDVPVGNRTRIITAMMLGVPVIAHDNTALGNPHLVDGETCYLARNAETFVDRMKCAFRGGEEVEKIVRHAREVYETEYRPDVANQRMLGELRHLL